MIAESLISAGRLFNFSGIFAAKVLFLTSSLDLGTDNFHLSAAAVSPVLKNDLG